MEINVQLQVALFVILGFFIDLFECFVTLSPFGVAQACVGQQLEVTCATNETFLVWNFIPPLVNDQGVSIPQNWFIASRDISQQIQPLVVNSTLFTFMRTSSRNSSSLVSSLTIINSSSAINMAVVSCTEIVGNKRATSVLTTILVIGDTHTDNLSPPEVNTIPMFQMDGVSVTLEWMLEDGVSYNVSADQEVNFRFIQRATVNLTVPYNTPTNVTVTATLCQQNRQTAITFLELTYGECADPSLSITDSVIMVVGYDNLSLSGTVVTFSCSPGVVLNGPNSSTCMANGQWEPDPGEVECTETPPCQIPSSSPDGYIIPYNSTDDKIRVTFACQSDCAGELKYSLELYTAVCTSNGDLEINPLDICSCMIYGENLLTVVVASVAGVFLVLAIIIFIIGFVCGERFGQKLKRPLSQAPDAHPLEVPSVPIYESVLRDTMDEEQAITLGENVAYGPPAHDVLP